MASGVHRASWPVADPTGISNANVNMETLD